MCMLSLMCILIIYLFIFDVCQCACVCTGFSCSTGPVARTTFIAVWARLVALFVADAVHNPVHVYAVINAHPNNLFI